MTPTEYDFLAQLTKELPNGDIIVAGTENGTDVRTILSADKARNIVVIDSFNGLAEPAEEDICDLVMEAGECDIGGLENYIDTFYATGIEPPKEIYQMWISDKKLKKIKKRKIALLFLDLDHYEPTKSCLKRFKDWIVSEGWILVHDYDFVRCPGIKKCCDEISDKWEKVPETGFAKLRIE